MKIFCLVFGLSITISLLFSLPMIYSWIFHLSATIHKNYMFLLCNGLLVFIRLNSRSICGFSPGKYSADGQTGKSGYEEVVGSYESKPLDGIRMVGEVEDEKETGDGLLYAVEVEVRENESVIAENDVNEVDNILSIIVEETHEELEREREGDVTENDKSLLLVDETGTDGLEVEEGEGPEGGTATISLEELNKKCEEFIRRMKEEIRFESRTKVCYYYH